MRERTHECPSMYDIEVAVREVIDAQATVDALRNDELVEYDGDLFSAKDAVEEAIDALAAAFGKETDDGPA